MKKNIKNIIKFAAEGQAYAVKQAIQTALKEKVKLALEDREKKVSTELFNGPAKSE